MLCRLQRNRHQVLGMTAAEYVATVIDRVF
jgi:hypothetical protein